MVRTVFFVLIDFIFNGVRVKTKKLEVERYFPYPIGSIACNSATVILRSAIFLEKPISTGFSHDPPKPDLLVDYYTAMVA